MGKPKIRFKGYTEDWEQRKLGDITVKIGSGKTPSGGKNAYVETGIPLIRSQNVNGDKVNFADIVYIDEATDESMANSRVYTNDVLLNITGASIGRSAVYKGLESANVNQHVCIIRSIEGHQPDFIQLNLSSDNGQKQIDESQAGGGREGLNFQEIGKMQFFFPSLNEQKCIGRYFNSLDHLITLHQRKCDETKKLKKCMLQKMFPKEGEKVPEIRFSGFTGDWKQRKLGDVFKEYSEKNHAEQPALTIMQGEGTIKREDSERNLLYNKSNLSSYKMVYKDDFIVHLRSFEGGLEKASCNGIVSPAYHIFHGEKADSRFYYSYFRSYEFIKRKLVPHIYGIRDGRSIDIAGMKTIDIPYPSFEEQQRIGDYLDSVNNLITFHQRKCDELKNIKKFMLQNMFVSEK